MDNFFELFWKTILLRPYVFAFLTVYIISSSLYIGFARALLYIPVGYLIAWGSEWLSINYGLPYGLYHYIPSTMGKELWVGGIPFMDSLSYVFLSYSAYGVTDFLWLRSKIANDPSSWTFTFLGAGFLTLLDVIIDPVALRGDRWFLGKIYEYPSGGFYFGVPLSNFIGWFIVGLILIRILQHLGKKHFYDHSRKSSVGRAVAVGLYGGVIIFNLVVTIYIKAWSLVIADVIVLLLGAVFLKTIPYYSSQSTISDRS